ncbi:MAG: ribonuclease H [Candidatus Saccharimonadales bacterium]
MIIYYTDGSCEPNPGKGGYSVIRVNHDGEGLVSSMEPVVLGREPSGEQTTNIRMEGYAIMAALKDADGAECEIFSDSEFWIKVITVWSLPWEKNGWKKKGGEIKNLDIVQEVVPLYRASKAKLTWVRGHVGDPGNEMADHCANQARLGIQL